MTKRGDAVNTLTDGAAGTPRRIVHVVIEGSRVRAWSHVHDRNKHGVRFNHSFQWEGA